MKTKTFVLGMVFTLTTSSVALACPTRKKRACRCNRPSSHLQNPNYPLNVSPRGVVVLMNHNAKSDDISAKTLGLELLNSLPR